MARKGENQKLKMLYLTKIFLEETDDAHGLTMPEIIDKLEAYGVNADRKTLYRDFEELRNFGLDIISNKSGHNVYYGIGGRDFELPELKLLVDSVQSAKFITDRKSSQLIKKLESLVSVHEAKQLHRQVIMSGRIKTMNESIYYNVDKLHEAINENKQIKFKYFDWNLKKEMEPRYDGMWYQRSPWALMWDDEKYYLVVYDSKHGNVTHYRVDKMMDIRILDEPREGREAFSKFNVAKYTNTLFGMFSGDETKVMLEAENYMAGVLIDRFGKDIMVIPDGKDHIRIRVPVCVSPQFFGWLTGLGSGAELVSPEEVRGSYREFLKDIMESYR